MMNNEMTVPMEVLPNYLYKAHPVTPNLPAKTIYDPIDHTTEIKASVKRFKKEILDTGLYRNYAE